MKKINFAVKMMLPMLFFMSIAFVSCSKDEEKDKTGLAPTGELAPPSWLIGTWGDGGLYADYIVTAKDFTPANVMTFKEMTELASTLSVAFGGPAIKVQEIAKSDVLYEVGVQEGKSVEKSYYFKKGEDGSFIEVAKYDTDAKKWGEFERYNKKNQ